MHEENNKKITTRYRWVLIGSLLVAAFYLILEHRAHLVQNASYIVFGLFILMHFFMHRGHGGHGGHGDHGNSDEGRHRHDTSDNKQTQ